MKWNNIYIFIIFALVISYGNTSYGREEKIEFSECPNGALDIGAADRELSPVLWFDRERLGLLRRDICRYEWMKGLYQGIEREAANALLEDLVIPEYGGVLRPELFPGGELVVELSPTEFYSSAEKKIYKGTTEVRSQGNVVLHNFPFRQYFDYVQHGVLSNNTKLMAFVYVVANNQKYAEKVKQILLGYALRFEQDKYPMHSFNGDRYEPDHTPSYSGRLMVNSSEDVIWYYDMMLAYDWTNADGLYSNGEQELILKMFQTMFETTMRRLGEPAHPDNHTAVLNFGRMVFGILTDNQTLIEQSSDGELGIKAQLDRAMNEEGLTESWGIGYHFAFMHHIIYTSELHNRAGYGDLFSYADRKIKKGVDALIKFTYIDGRRIPNIQTAAPEWNWTPSFNTVFEPAYARYEDPLYLPSIWDELKFLPQNEYSAHREKWGDGVVRGTYTSRGDGRTYVEGLIMGKPDATLSGSAPVLSSVHFPKSKYVYLRQGNVQDGVGVFLTYQNEQVGHSDLMGFQFYAFGQELGLESGMSQSYTAEEYGAWHAQRVAHNTVVVDQSSPGIPPHYTKYGDISSIGKADLLEFSSNPESPYTVLSADGTLYSSVDMTRSVRLLDGNIHVLDQLRSSEEHIYDWSYRNSGEVKSVAGVKLFPWEGELGQDFGYEEDYIFDITRGFTNSAVTITWLSPSDPYTNEKAEVKLHIAAHPDTEIILGRARLDWKTGSGPILLIRRNTANTNYEVVIKPQKHLIE
jgi:hypothetical protein